MSVGGVVCWLDGRSWSYCVVCRAAGVCTGSGRKLPVLAPMPHVAVVGVVVSVVAVVVAVAAVMTGRVVSTWQAVVAAAAVVRPREAKMWRLRVGPTLWRT